ncbi:hypothetical protein HMPREF0972_00837 [Actinomyces sp. oral taxon 848 str. F0332]|nr:hypothetical protein HMPREF0972_00837 [Actinomyces sp. oral taxon 848 str. F0332]
MRKFPHLVEADPSVLERGARLPPFFGKAENYRIETSFRL